MMSQHLKDMHQQHRQHCHNYNYIIVIDQLNIDIINIIDQREQTVEVEVDEEFNFLNKYYANRVNNSNTSRAVLLLSPSKQYHQQRKHKEEEKSTN